MGTMNLPWLPLLGQAIEVAELGADANPPVTLSSIVLLSLVGLATLSLVVGLPVFLGVRSERRRRELEHLERMRALELGRPIPGEASGWTPAKAAIGIGVGVPIASFAIAFAAAEKMEAASPFIWPSVGAVGLAAVICGTVLAARIPASRPTAPDPLAKPQIDPDSFEMAAHHHP